VFKIKRRGRFSKNGAADPNFNDRDNHLILFEKDIPGNENLRHLTAIAGRRLFVSALPVAGRKIVYALML
jgi:hypothetical protein